MNTAKKYLPMKLTRQGKQLLAKVQAGMGNIKITHFETGSGIYQDGEDYSLRESLKEPKQEFLISSKTVETDDSVVLEVEITNCPEEGTGLETGYKIREMAFFAENPEGGEICYCIMVGTDDLMMDYLPAYDGAIPSTITNYFHLKVANADKVEIVIKTGNIVNSEEGSNGLRIYQGKLQYINSKGEWQDINVDGSSIIIGEIPDIEEEEPELNGEDSLGILFGKIKKLLGLKVDKKDGDIADTKVSTITPSTETFPRLQAGEKQSILWGKVKKWQQDCLTKFGNYVLMSMITNQHLNSTSNIPTSALVYLMQQAIAQNQQDITVLNTNLKVEVGQATAWGAVINEQHCTKYGNHCDVYVRGHILPGPIGNNQSLFSLPWKIKDASRIDMECVMTMWNNDLKTLVPAPAAYNGQYATICITNNYNNANNFSFHFAYECD